MRDWWEWCRCREEGRRGRRLRRIGSRMGIGSGGLLGLVSVLSERNEGRFNGSQNVGRHIITIVVDPHAMVVRLLAQLLFGMILNFLYDRVGGEVDVFRQQGCRVFYVFGTSQNFMIYISWNRSEAVLENGQVSI